MKSIAALAFAASLASAQVTYNSTTNTFTCAIPNGNYCAGDSMSSNIIIRCNNGVGGPGNCNDNLSGEPPMGVFGSLCYQSSNTAGDAACEKNCVVYAQPSFTLPASVCQPSYTATTSTSTSTSTASMSGGSAGTTITTAVTATTTVCPVSSSTTMSTVTGSGSGSNTTPPSNGTATATTASGSKTPVGPTTTTTSSPSSVVTAGAAVHKAGGALAVAGLVAAYFI